MDTQHMAMRDGIKERDAEIARLRARVEVLEDTIKRNPDGSIDYARMVSSLQSRIRELEAVVEAVKLEHAGTVFDCPVCKALAAVQRGETTTGSAKECEPEDY